ncbi:MAG: hypothetical protein ACHREM_09940 [Polyangiales bacterium]
MSIKTLVERAVRDSQDDFAAVLEQKLAVRLAGEEVPTPSASRQRRARAPATKPTKASRGRARPEATAGPRSKAARPVNPVNVTPDTEALAAVPASAAIVGADDFEIDLPILRAIAHEDAVMIVGGYPSVETLAEIPRLTGLKVERVVIAPEVAEARLASLVDRVRRDTMLGLVFVGDGGFGAADLALVIAEARKTAVPIARSADGSLASLLSALDTLERVASGSTA